MTRQEIIAERLATLRASVAGGEEDHAHIAFKRVVFAAMAAPGCEAQGVRLVDLPRLAERVAEMADAHERVVGERDAARAALAKEEHAHGITIDQRENAQSWADSLANQIASAADHDIGEHTNLNNPWDNAQDGLEKLVKERDALRAERDELAATLANERGEGEPPTPGWKYDAGEWVHPDATVSPVVATALGGSVRRRWEWGTVDKAGQRDTARAAMRAAAAGVKS